MGDESVKDLRADCEMKLLLDTHVWVWAAEEPRRLGRKTRRFLQDENCERFVCAVSALEVARLVWSGDMVLQIPVGEWIEKSLSDLRADSLPVTHEIAVEAYSLPEPFHRDPADRQIVACARLKELTVVTADERVLDWKHVATLDARK
jgi:PIN domain nuclease of toxin-antitoxin system